MILLPTASFLKYPSTVSYILTNQVQLVGGYFQTRLNKLNAMSINFV